MTTEFKANGLQSSKTAREGYPEKPWPKTTKTRINKFKALLSKGHKVEASLDCKEILVLLHWGRGGGRRFKVILSKVNLSVAIIVRNFPRRSSGLAPLPQALGQMEVLRTEHSSLFWLVTLLSHLMKDISKYKTCCFSVSSLRC